MMGLVATTYSTSDSALTSLTTSFCVDILGFERRKGAVVETTLRRWRLAVHLGFTLLFVGMIFVFSALGSGAVLNTLFQAHGFTYGPILGLFAFGFFYRMARRGSLHWRGRGGRRRVNLADRFTHWSRGFMDCSSGSSRLALNGLLMFAGLCAIRKPALAAAKRRSPDSSR